MASSEKLLKRLHRAYNEAPELPRAPGLETQILDAVRRSARSGEYGSDPILSYLKGAYRSAAVVAPHSPEVPNRVIERIRAQEAQLGDLTQRTWRALDALGDDAVDRRYVRTRLLAMLKERGDGRYRKSSAYIESFWDNVIKGAFVAAPFCLLIAYVTFSKKHEQPVPVLVIFQENEGF